MTSREQFEEEMSDKYEWFSDAIACADFCGDDDHGYYVGGDYIYHEALFWLWRGWQASRLAIEIQACPYPNDHGPHVDDYYLAQINNAGLKVKK